MPRDCCQFGLRSALFHSFYRHCRRFLARELSKAQGVKMPLTVALKTPPTSRARKRCGQR